MGKLRQGLCGAGGRRQADGGGERPHPARLRPLLRPQPDQRRPGAHLRAAAGGHGAPARPAPVGARHLGLLSPPGGPRRPHPRPGPARRAAGEEGGCAPAVSPTGVMSSPCSVPGGLALCRAPPPAKPTPSLPPTQPQIYGGGQGGAEAASGVPWGGQTPPHHAQHPHSYSLPKPHPPSRIIPVPVPPQPGLL